MCQSWLILDDHNRFKVDSIQVLQQLPILVWEDVRRLELPRH